MIESGDFLLNNILKLFGIKDNNSFLAKFFGGLTFLTLVYIFISFITFLVGEGRLNDIHPMIFAVVLTFPPLAYSYLVNTKMLKHDKQKIKWFIITASSFGIIVSTMTINILNGVIWWGLQKLPNYADVMRIYPEVFGPSIKTVCLILPFIFIFQTIDFFLLIYRDEDLTKGICGFGGISANVSKEVSGPFSCEVTICVNPSTAVPVVVPEKKRMEATLVQGATGTGKTAMILFPMSAIDIEKKYFFREYSKKIAYSLLKRGVAYIEGPFTNEYINRNFRLNFIKPKKGFEDTFYSELKDVILFKDSETGNVVYKNLGITVVENDGKYVSDFANVAKNFDMDVAIVDPISPEITLSINPFALKEPPKVASIIADVLKAMYESEGGSGAGDPFFTQVTLDAFQNLAILLKEMYPILNNGEMASLEDMLELLYNFDAVEEMVEEMRKIPELEQKYKLLISYFQRNFYKPSLNINGYEIPGTRGSGRKETEKFLYGAITQLNNLLRHPGLKKALCGKVNVLNFDKALEEGYLITACSRKGELGIIQSKAFGMFFILQFQDSVLRRSGSEDSRIPNFLYIDEFPEYINKETEVMFTLFRKYRCGVIIAIQNLSQLEKKKEYAYYRQTVLANTKTQIVFGDTVPEDSKYWSAAFGEEVQVDHKHSFNPESGDVVKTSKIEVGGKERVKVRKIQDNKFGKIYYKTKNAAGTSVIGEGKVSFIADKFNTKHPAYMYNFEKYMIVKPIDSNYNTSDMEDNDDDNLFGSYSPNSKTSVENTNDEFDKFVNNLEHVDEEIIEQNNQVIEQSDNQNQDQLPPEPIKEFNFDDNDDFEIVIDTGTNEKKLDNAKSDGGAITEDYEPDAINIKKSKK